MMIQKIKFEALLLLFVIDIVSFIVSDIVVSFSVVVYYYHCLILLFFAVLLILFFFAIVVSIGIAIVNAIVTVILFV